MTKFCAFCCSIYRRLAQYICYKYLKIFIEFRWYTEYKLFRPSGIDPGLSPACRRLTGFSIPSNGVR